MNLVSTQRFQVDSVLPADGWRPVRRTHYSMDCIERFPLRCGQMHFVVPRVGHRKTGSKRNGLTKKEIVIEGRCLLLCILCLPSLPCLLFSQLISNLPHKLVPLLRAFRPLDALRRRAIDHAQNRPALPRLRHKHLDRIGGRAVD